MPIPGAILVPHPPVLIPAVGQGREQQMQKTVDAYQTAARRVRGWRPDVLIILSPHITMYLDYFHIAPGQTGRGTMGSHGAPGTALSVPYDGELRQEIIRQAREAGIPAGSRGLRDRELDHGTFLPLYFLKETGVECPVVRIGLSGMSPLLHYQFGQCIQRAVNALRRRAVVVASGNLSHRMREDGPYGYDPEGPRFDAAVTGAMISGNFMEFLTMDTDLQKKAAECGLRSFQVMAGILDGLEVVPDFLSYESPHGVGYSVAVFTILDRSRWRKFGEQYLENERRRIEGRKKEEDSWVQLARLALETCVCTGSPLQDLPEELPREMTRNMAGTFVSIHKEGRLRGCIGTIRPTTRCVALEIMRNAVSAGTRDPRFPPVQKEELEQLEYSVDVLGKPERIASAAQLDVKRYGVIVTSGRRQGLLLPGLEGVDTAEDQIAIACRKAGIQPGERVTLQRFEVVRHQ